MPLMPGDRFVIRESGRDETVGGGEILDVAPVLPASRARPDRDLERVLAERGWVRAEHWQLLTGSAPSQVVGGWVVDPQLFTATVEQVRELVSAAGPLGYDTAGLNEHQRAVLDTMSDVRTEAGRAVLVTAPDPLADHPYLEWFRSGGLAPEALTDADRTVLRELARRGHLWERDGIWFHLDAIETAVHHVWALLADDPAGFTVSQFRERAGVTRKHAVPLLGELDARAITRRRDDLRIAGPRMPGQ
jgi:selenocysteine-specific elongation factor